MSALKHAMTLADPCDACPCVDISGQRVDISGQKVLIDVTGLTVVVDISGVVITTDISGQRVDISGQRVDISGQRVDISGQRVDISGQRVIADLSGQSVALTLANAAGDAFGRLRVSNPFTLFEFNSIVGTGVFGQSPSIIDTSSGGTGLVTHSTNSYTAMDVSAAGDFVIRQSHEYILYQPGKSKLTMMTGVLHQDASNNPAYSTNQLTARIGIFDASMGIFVEYENGTYKVVLRSNTGYTQTIPRASWTDPLDGTGPSGATVDFTQAQIYMFDMEWLGVGQVRCAIVQSGVIHYFYAFQHVNMLLAPYILTAKLPLCYEIRSTGSRNQMRMICGTVISEGGFSPFGLRNTFPVGNISTYNSVFGTNYNTTTTNTPYWNTLGSETFIPMISIRVKNTYPHRVGSIRIKNVDVFNSGGSNTFGCWRLIMNADVSGGTFVDYDISGSIAQVCLHKFNTESGANHTYTQNSGIVLYNNFYTTRENSLLFSSVEEMISQPPICVNLNGISDRVTLVANAINNASNKLYASIEWIEFV